MRVCFVYAFLDRLGADETLQSRGSIQARNKANRSSWVKSPLEVEVGVWCGAISRKQSSRWSLNARSTVHQSCGKFCFFIKQETNASAGINERQGLFSNNGFAVHALLRRWHRQAERLLQL